MGWNARIVLVACALLSMGPRDCWDQPPPGAADAGAEDPGHDNEPPSAVLVASAVVGQAPFEVDLDGSASSDPEGSLAELRWDFGDGETAVGETARHTYATLGPFLVTLTVTDTEGALDSAWVEIVVARNLLPNSAFEDAEDGAIAHWRTVAWRAGPTFSWAAGEGRNDSRAVRIDIAPSAPNDAAWIKPIQLDPDMTYNLYGWLRGQDISGGGLGANLSVHGTFESSDAAGSKGTFAYRPAVFTFVTDDTGFVTLACRLGFFGSTVSGTLWCDDLFLTTDDFAAPRSTTHFLFRLERNDLLAIRKDHYADWLAGLDAAYELYADLVGDVPYAGERIVVQSVRQYPGGWAVAGNPIHWMQEYIGPELAEIDETGSLSFGVLHEIGHDFDLDGRWNWQGEVLACFKMVYVLEELDALVAQADVFYRGGEIRQAYWIASDEGTTPSWALVVYRLIELTDEVGWEPFRETFRAFGAMASEEIPATSREKFDTFLGLVGSFAGIDALSRIPPAELAWVYDQLD